MTLLGIAWRNLRARALLNGLTAAVVILGVALAVTGLLMTQAVKDGMKRASAPFDMIVGAKGSSTQLVMNTIFLQDVPLGNIPHSLFVKLAGDDRVASSVPIGLGDNLHGFRIIGTTPSFFALRESPDSPAFFRLQTGQYFQKEFEAVLGAGVARQLRLKPGDTFKPSHGVIETHAADGGEDKDHDHEQVYTIVGLLNPTGSPLDNGVYTSLDSVWEIHGQEAKKQGDVTAVLVRPKSISGLMRLYQEINAGKEAQAVFPGQVMAQLFDMMGKGQSVFQAISVLVLAMSSLTVVITLLSAGAQRRREVAIMRSLGARRSDIVSVVLLECGLLGLAGLAGGIALAHGLVLIMQRLLATETGVVVSNRFVSGEFWVLLAVGLLSLAAGVIPALRMYRVEVARELGNT